MTGTAYLLTLTDQDIETIAFVGGRYCWSDALRSLAAGDNELTESEAWVISEAIEADMVGGHDAYPMLDTSSTLCTKLHSLYQSIV